MVGDPRLTPDQSRAQLTMWSIWSAPLIMSNDLRNIETVYKEILLNKRVIAVDQDPLGVMGRMVKKVKSRAILKIVLDSLVEHLRKKDATL